MEFSLGNRWGILIRFKLTPTLGVAMELRPVRLHITVFCIALRVGRIKGTKAEIHALKQ